MLERAVGLAGPDTVLVAHSLGCLLVARWAARTRRHIKAALLVAVPDPAAPAFPVQVTGFTAAPLRTLPFRSVVVSSTDDPYGSLAYARICASAWESELVVIGPAGHINADSGYGDWEAGHGLLQTLLG